MHFCHGLDCRISYKSIRYKVDVLRQWFWFDGEPMGEAIERFDSILHFIRQLGYLANISCL